MSMILGLATIEDSTITQLLRAPEQVWRVIAPDDPEIHEPGHLDLAEGEVSSVDLDKAWHGIHYLLTGTAWMGSGPSSFLLCGGQEVGDVDVGYGPARALDSAEVKAAHEVLTGLTDAELRARFRPADMLKQEIYPDIWNRDAKEDNTLGYLMEYVSILRNFLAAAVAKGRGVLIYLT